MLELTYAFIGYLMGCIALLVSLYVWFIVDEIKNDRVKWIKHSQDLKNRIYRLEKGGRAEPWKKSTAKGYFDNL
jgi:hypothetical protein